MLPLLPRAPDVVIIATALCGSRLAIILSERVRDVFCQTSTTAS
jgi:hypothetical protein